MGTSYTNNSDAEMPDRSGQSVHMSSRHTPQQHHEVLRGPHSGMPSSAAPSPHNKQPMPRSSDSHLAPSPHSQRLSGVRSPNKSGNPAGPSAAIHTSSAMIPASAASLNSLQHHPQQVAASQMGMAPFPYQTIGNQVVMVLPNMVAPGGIPAGLASQLINPALLQQQQMKSDQHLAALTPQQQQVLMAQQLHALNATNPEYLRAIQQAMESQQQALSRVSSAEFSNLYRQYGAQGLPAGSLLQPSAPSPHQQAMLMRSAQQSSNAPSPHQSHNHNPSTTQGPSSVIGIDQSQRGGSIMTGLPVFGSGLANPYAAVNTSGAMQYNPTSARAPQGPPS